MNAFKTFATVAALAASMVATGTVIAGDRTLPQSSWSMPMMGTWGPRGMAGYGPMGPGMMGYGGAGPWMMESASGVQAMCGAMASHLEGRLAYIKAELKITADQEPLWKAYATAAQDDANTILGRCTTMMGHAGGANLSLPDRLDLHEQLMSAQLDSMRTIHKSLKPLYGALSETQKKAANELFWGPMGMM